MKSILSNEFLRYLLPEEISRLSAMVAPSPGMAGLRTNFATRGVDGLRQAQGCLAMDDCRPGNDDRDGDLVAYSQNASLHGLRHDLRSSADRSDQAVMDIFCKGRSATRDCRQNSHRATMVCLKRQT